MNDKEPVEYSKKDRNEIDLRVQEREREFERLSNHPSKCTERGDIHGEIECFNGRVDHDKVAGKEPKLVEEDRRVQFVLSNVKICFFFFFVAFRSSPHKQQDQLRSIQILRYRGQET